MSPVPPASEPILVVEDDDDLRVVIVLALELAGSSAVGVTNGRWALDYLDSGGLPSAILLDLKMPRADGARFLWALLDEPRWAKIPVIVCSGDCDAIRNRALPGVGSWLYKPFTASTLIHALHRIAS
jgi:CheY-like chemotaxis protein